MNARLTTKYMEGLDKVTWASCVYPIAATLFIFLTWMLAWITLGHPPQPSRDDPDAISRIITLFRAATMTLLVLSFPGLLVSAFFVLFGITERAVSKKPKEIFLVI